MVQSDAPVKQAAPAPAPGVTAQFYHWDHVGTVRLITDNAGHVVSRHDYTPYGVEVLPAVSVSGNTHQFTGQERDPMTGSDYMHFRYYGSTMGRFYKPDNITGSAMNPQDWNRYSYVHGNPINFNDPTGHDPNDPKKEKQEGLKTVKELHHSGEKTGEDAVNHWKGDDDGRVEVKVKSANGQMTISAPAGSNVSVSLSKDGKVQATVSGAGTGQRAKTVAPLKGTQQSSSPGKAKAIAGEVMALSGKVLKVQAKVNTVQGIFLGAIGSVATFAGRPLIAGACGFGVAGCAGKALLYEKVGDELEDIGGSIGSGD
jgi:RHS repeat-associated protein